MEFHSFCAVVMYEINKFHSTHMPSIQDNGDCVRVISYCNEVYNYRISHESHKLFYHTRIISPNKIIEHACTLMEIKYTETKIPSHRQLYGVVQNRGGIPSGALWIRHS